MAVHPAGDGVAWTTDVDVDQPHGLDYRYTNHVAIGVASRNNKEHKTYADATVGGEHLPGGCRVLAFVDSTADMTVGVADASIDITDGQFIGRGLIYDQTNNSFWCWTADGTTTDDPYQIMFGPDSICLGGDFTWTGEIQFDGTVSHQSAMDVSVVNGDGTVTFTALVDVSTLQVELIDETFSIESRVDLSSVGISGDSTITADVDMSGDFNLDGQLILDTNNIYTSGWFDVSRAGTYTKTHDLSSTNVVFTMQFKDTENDFLLGADRIYQIPTNLSAGAEYNAAVTNITSTQATIQAGADNVAMSYNTSGVAVYSTCGSYQVIATKL